MKEIKEIIALIDSNLIERYKQLTGDTDELFENIAVYLLEGTYQIPIEVAAKEFGLHHAKSLLTKYIEETLSAFGG